MPQPDDAAALLIDIAQCCCPWRHVIYPDGMPLRRLTTVARPLISNAVVQMQYVPSRGCRLP